MLRMLAIAVSMPAVLVLDMAPDEVACTTMGRVVVVAEGAGAGADGAGAGAGIPVNGLHDKGQDLCSMLLPADAADDSSNVCASCCRI